MNIPYLRAFDKYLLGGLTALLGPFVRLFGPAEPPQRIERILVIKLWAIGDAVLTLPLVRALRERYPEAEISILCHRSNRPVFDATGDGLMVIEAGAWNVARLIRTYDVCFDTEPFLNLSALLSWVLARTRVGFRNRLRWLFYDHTVDVAGDRHALERVLDMGRFLGVQGAPGLLSLEVPESTGYEVEKTLAERGIRPGDRLIGICAGTGASVKARQWPKENFRDLVRRILEAEPETRILLVGTAAEFETNEFIRDGHHRAINLSGTMALAETFGLIRRMAAFVSNDTGPMHIAAAQGVPTLGLFGPSSPHLWGPYGAKHAFLWAGPGVCEHCPCNLPHQGRIPECILRDDRHEVCIRAIPVDEVFRKYGSLGT